MKLNLWNGMLWDDTDNQPHAYCLEHKQMLEIRDGAGYIDSQSNPGMESHLQLICPEDKKAWDIPEFDYYVLQRRYVSTRNARLMKDVQIVDLDGMQVPIAVARTPLEDAEYWAEVRINKSKKGKQLVVYAGRRGASDKVQLFLDLENDKITFDQNNLHPNEVFTRVVADFDSGRSVAMDASKQM